MNTIRAASTGLALLSGFSAYAVLFVESDGVGYHTSAPGGSLTDSGWQYQGNLGGFLGTPISSRHLLTAAHLGNSYTTFQYGGSSYNIRHLASDPGSDLSLYQIVEADYNMGIKFSTYTPLYTKSDESQKAFVVYGKGARRGTEVVGHGWKWGSGGQVQRWGENTVAGFDSSGVYLAAVFGPANGVTGASLSVGDSGGGLFIKDGPTWKLAGINYAVESPFDSDGVSPFPLKAQDGDIGTAALYDMNGVFIWDGSAWVPAEDRGSAMFASRVSARLDWLDNFVVVPEPAAWAASGLLALAGVLYRRCAARD